jgi:hypothetical protein
MNHRPILPLIDETTRRMKIATGQIGDRTVFYADDFDVRSASG